MLRQKTTNRKFYNKWFYKITVQMPGARAISAHSHESLENYLLGNSPGNYSHYSNMYKAWNNRFGMLKLLYSIKDIPTDLYATRFQSDFLDLYTNDLEIFEKFKKDFESRIKHVFVPTQKLLDSADSNVVVSKRLAHNKYKFKVYLKPHKFKGDVESKKSFLSWLDTQKDRIMISKTVRDWFLVTDWNWDRRYMFVEDEKTLMMAKLRAPEVMGKVLEYVINDK